MEEKKKVKVTIGGMQYALLTDESTEYTQEIAAHIDAEMRELLSSNPFISSNQAAVLLAIEYLDASKKAEQLAETYRSQIKDYLKDTSEAQSERDFYKRELDRMRAEVKGKADQLNLFAAEDAKTEKVIQEKDAEIQNEKD